MTPLMWALAVMFVLGFVVNAMQIGKPRTTLTPGMFVWVTVLTFGLYALYAWLGTK